VFGLDARDGKRLWVFDRATVPLLSLRGNSAPRIDGGVVYVGEDNGKVIAVRANDGGELWEQQIAAGEGRSDAERLQDVDGAIKIDSGVVYASGYRGQTVALIAQSGRPLWTHELSSFTGVALSASALYGSDADSSIWALDVRSGASEWKQDGLKYRWVGEPAVQGDAVVLVTSKASCIGCRSATASSLHARACPRNPSKPRRSWSAMSSMSRTSKARSAHFASASSTVAGL
jgi:outer membrane protein assembly factor BamB